MPDSCVITHGVARPLATEEVISLHKQGVSTRVIKALQEPPRVARAPAVAQPVPAPVIVEQHHYGPPLWGPPHHYHYRRHRPHPGVSWGVSVSN